jgi:hypothetical protein
VPAVSHSTVLAPADVEDTCIELNYLLRRLDEEHGDGVVVVLLDACRENPDDITFRRRMVARSGSGARNPSGGLSGHIGFRTRGMKPAAGERCV